MNSKESVTENRDALTCLFNQGRQMSRSTESVQFKFHLDAGTEITSDSVES